MCLKMNEKVKISWDMKIQTGKLTEQSRPDIVVLKKESSDEINEFHILESSVD